MALQALTATAAQHSPDLLEPQENIQVCHRCGTPPGTPCNGCSQIFCCQEWCSVVRIGEQLFCEDCAADARPQVHLEIPQPEADAELSVSTDEVRLSANESQRQHGSLVCPSMLRLQPFLIAPAGDGCDCWAKNPCASKYKFSSGQHLVHSLKPRTGKDATLVCSPSKDKDYALRFQNRCLTTCMFVQNGKQFVPFNLGQSVSVRVGAVFKHATFVGLSFYKPHMKSISKLQVYIRHEDGAFDWLLSIPSISNTCTSQESTQLQANRFMTCLIRN